LCQFFEAGRTPNLVWHLTFAQNPSLRVALGRPLPYGRPSRSTTWRRCHPLRLRESARASVATGGSASKLCGFKSHPVHNFFFIFFYFSLSMIALALALASLTLLALAEGARLPHILVVAADGEFFCCCCCVLPVPLCLSHSDTHKTTAGTMWGGGTVRRRRRRWTRSRQTQSTLTATTSTSAHRCLILADLHTRSNPSFSSGTARPRAPPS
jgi:hypothetical protein